MCSSSRYSVISSTRNFGMRIERLDFGVFGSVTTSSPLMRWYDFVMFSLAFWRSKSAGVSANSSPSLMPHQ